MEVTSIACTGWYRGCMQVAEVRTIGAEINDENGKRNVNGGDNNFQLIVIKSAAATAIAIAIIIIKFLLLSLSFKGRNQGRLSNPVTYYYERALWLTTASEIKSFGISIESDECFVKIDDISYSYVTLPLYSFLMQFTSLPSFSFVTLL